METTETRAKLANAIRDLQAKGDTETINHLVSAYKVKYRTGVSTENQLFTPQKTFGEKYKDFSSKMYDVVNKIIPSGTIGEYAGSKLMQKIGTPEQQEYAKSVQPTEKQVAGAALQTASLFFPYGKVASAGAKAIPFLGKAAKPLANIASGAMGGYGMDVWVKLGEGKTWKEAFTPWLGTALGAGLPAIWPVARGVGILGREVLGVTTGTGAGTIKEFGKAVRAGGEIAEGAYGALRGKIAPQEIVEEAKSGLNQIIQKRRESYVKQLEKLKTSKKTFDHTPIIEKFNKQLEDFGVFANPDGTPNFSRSPWLGRYEKDLMAMSETLKNWWTRAGDDTIVGIDKLKQTLDDFRIGSADSRKFDTFVTSLRNEAKWLLKNETGYNKLVNDYEKSTGLIKDIEKELSLGDKKSVDTAFRKLSTIFRVNNEVRKQVFNELNQLSGGTLSAKIAGQQLSELLPRGLLRPIAVGAWVISGAGIVPVLKLAAFASPRIVGETIGALGIVGRKADEIIKLLAPQGFKMPWDIIFNKGYSTKPPILSPLNSMKSSAAKNIQKNNPLLTRSPTKATTNKNVFIPKSIPKTSKKVNPLLKGKGGIPETNLINDDTQQSIQKYLTRAYKVYDNQSVANTVAQISKDVMQKTNLPKNIIVTQAFFEKMIQRHPEIPKNRLFEFVKTLNIPDEIYQLPEKSRLNFFRNLEELTNIVGTRMKNNQQVVTSILTSSKKYPERIKKTAEAVFLKDARGTATSSSLMQSPPAGQIISGVSNPFESIAKSNQKVNPLLPWKRK